MSTPTIGQARRIAATNGLALADVVRQIERRAEQQRAERRAARRKATRPAGASRSQLRGSGPLPERIADALAERIAAGTYGTGGRVPTMNELADAYGVSRPTIRAALLVLAARGVAEPKNRPAAERIADAIAERITGGAYPPGGRLPDMTRLADEFGVSVPTIRGALTLLAERGMVDIVRYPASEGRVRGRGIYATQGREVKP